MMYSTQSLLGKVITMDRAHNSTSNKQNKPNKGSSDISVRKDM